MKFVTITVKYSNKNGETYSVSESVDLDELKGNIHRLKYILESLEFKVEEMTKL